MSYLKIKQAVSFFMYFTDTIYRHETMSGRAINSHLIKARDFLCLYQCKIKVRIKMKVFLAIGLFVAAFASAQGKFRITQSMILN